MDEQDRKAAIKVVAENETKGTFQEIKSDAKDMASSVKQSGETAAKGLKDFGEEAEKTALKLTREEGRMSAALLRATEQAQIAAKAGDSLSKSFELKGELRGLDMSRLSPMVVQLREAEQALAAFKAQQSKQASQSAFLEGLRAQTEIIGKTKLELLELKAAQLGLTSQAAPYIAQIRNADGAMGSAGKSAKELQWALRGVPAQLSDIAVGIQGGMPAMTIFFQQGLQLRDMFGGFGAAARGVGTAVLGMVNPFTVGAAAVLALGVAYYQGSKEIDAYRKSLVLSGNQAGTTVAQLNAMAAAMASAVGTQGAAAAGLAEMAKSSKVGSDNLKEYTTSAVLWQKATGQAVSETAKQFAELANDPLKASLALNEQMNHLTASVYDQIKALEQAGRTEEAAAVAQKAYSDAMASRRAELVENLGYIERAVNFITTSAKQMWDAVLGIGRTTAPSDQFAAHITELEARIADRNRRAKEDGDPAWAIGTAKLQAQVDAAKQLAGAASSVDNYAASLQANNKAYVDASEAFSQMSDQFAPKEIKRKQELTVAENKYKAAVEATKKAFADMPELEGKLAALGKQFEQTRAGINKRYEEKGSAKPARDALSIDVYGTKKELEGLLTVYSSSQKIMEAQRSAGLLADSEYYEARRGFINLEADAQERMLQQELSRFQQEKVTKDNRLQVEKGIADTQAKIDKARIERSAALQVIDTQETASIHAKEAAYDAAARSAADYLATLQRGFDRNVLAVGWGSEQRNIEAGRQQLEDRFLQQRQDLANQRAKAELDANGKLNADQKRYYAERLELIEATEAIAMARYNDGVANRQAAEGDWLNGVKRAWSDYSYSAANVAQMSAEAFSNAFKGMEDALVSFTMTGKADFKSMANAFIADIVRIQARAALSGLFGGALNALGLGGIGGRLGLTLNAKGGVYDSPSLSVYRNQVIDKPSFFAFAKGGVPNLGVGGEAGPEAIMPLTRAPDGNLGVRALAPLPSLSSGGASAVQVQVYVDANSGSGQVQASASGSSNESMAQLGKLLGNAVKEQLTREMRPGGLLWSQRNGRA